VYCGTAAPEGPEGVASDGTTDSTTDWIVVETPAESDVTIWMVWVVVMLLAEVVVLPTGVTTGETTGVVVTAGGGIVVLP
jgi:hypothetical protein